MESAQLQAYTYKTLPTPDNTLDDIPLRTNCPLDDGRPSDGSTQQQQPLGSLDVFLPDEVILAILPRLDVLSLSTFRRVNRRAMGLVDCLHEYRTMRRHFPDVLRAVLSIRATHFDTATLFDTLCTERCSGCGGRNFGSHLYLITCERVCQPCFTSRRRFFPISGVVDRHGVDPDVVDLDRLPRVLSVPGTYTAICLRVRKRVVLYDLETLVDRAAIQRSGDGDTLRLDRLDLEDKEPRRYMGVISAPYFTERGRRAYWGAYCALCVDAACVEPSYKIKYTETGLGRHMMEWHGVDVDEEKVGRRDLGPYHVLTDAQPSVACG